jgi:hypothetical protein
MRKDRPREISFFHLPQMERDALILIHHLGITYLWVRTLRILRRLDGAAHEGWLLESSRIAETNGNTYVTITEPRVSGVSGSIYTSRPPPLNYQSLKIPLDEGPKRVSLDLDSELRFTESLDELLYSQTWTL